MPRRTVTKLTLKELHERVWSATLTKLGAELGITATGLTKICKKHNIPRPAQGYWQRVTLGKAELVTSLSEEVNSSLIVEIAATPKTEPEDYSDKTLERMAFEALHPLHVSEELTTLHLLSSLPAMGLRIVLVRMEIQTWCYRMDVRHSISV